MGMVDGSNGNGHDEARFYVWFITGAHVDDVQYSKAQNRRRRGGDGDGDGDDDSDSDDDHTSGRSYRAKPGGPKGYTILLAIGSILLFCM